MKKIFLPIFFSLLLVFSFSSNIIAEGTSTQINLIPIMTSNDAPTGHATASSVWSSNHQPFRLFNGDMTDVGWASIQGTPSGWVSYEFNNPVLVNHYTLLARADSSVYKEESPKDFTFEAWDGEKWLVLDSEENITNWEKYKYKEFSFTNETVYKKYRLNITKNNGLSMFTALNALEMYNTNPEPTNTPSPSPTATVKPTPTPTVTPTATPPVPSGDHAILTISMTTGIEKEFDLPMSEVNAFLDWYDTTTGSARYGINKQDNNKGPFSKRTDYVIHDKILSFEVSEYTAK
ncbi:discoidin domain-containing protein [Paenibacillus sp. P46E]|uniref:discoidin domain-containing protein n=1 Tax=Paenibacillus sp. P46E TaxID=1349436 RepID=UPI00093AF7F7|nr:discoidin domain-containing protein [Paenibacillus sp. P46E]OKP94364.1 hypothetical protein A3849_29450 [Paenibacillus sp. P46E]